MDAQLRTGLREVLGSLNRDVRARAIVLVGAGSRAPMRVSKRRFRELTQAGCDEALAAAVRAQLECCAQSEPQRAMREFVARRRSA